MTSTSSAATATSASGGLDWLRNQGTATSGPQLGPVFALLDPDSMQLEWSTIETIAMDWSGSHRPTTHVGAVELLILFPTGAFRRSMPIKSEQLRHRKRPRQTWIACLGIKSGDRSTTLNVRAPSTARTLGCGTCTFTAGVLNLGYNTPAQSRCETLATSSSTTLYSRPRTTRPKVMRTCRAVLGILPAMVEDEKRARRAGRTRLFEEDEPI